MATNWAGIASAGLSLVGSFGAMQGAQASYDAAVQQNVAEWKEFSRQQDENDRIADERAEMRIRMADANMGSMIAAMADGGGAGTTNSAAFAGEIGYLEGLDLRAIEKNREGTHQALEAKKQASSWRAINIINQTGGQVQETIWNNYGKAIGGLLPSQSGAATAPGTPQPQNVPSTQTIAQRRFSLQWKF